MFKVDESVPDNMLIKNGTYPATVVKQELTASSKGNPMIKLELAIPVDAVADQGQTMPVKVFDNILLGHSELMCKVKEKRFIQAFDLDGKDETALAGIVGMGCKIKVRQQHDDYGDRLSVSEYIKDADAVKSSVPF